MRPPAVVIYDIDDVWHPWCDLAHKASIIAGLCPEGTPAPGTWTPYEAYGVTAEDWYAALDLATRTGYLHESTPAQEDLAVFYELEEAGVEQHFVTARGHMDNAELIKELTGSWLETHFGGRYASLVFATDKGEVAKHIGATHGIDDNLRNVEDLISCGVRTFLMDKPWNSELTPVGATRVKSLREFGDSVLEGISS